MNPPASAHRPNPLSRDAVAQYLGVELLTLETGHAIVQMEIQEKHLNLFGTVHGGILFTLADIAFGYAGNAGEMPSVAIGATISYMKAVPGGVLMAEAHHYTSQGRFASYRVVIRDQEGAEIALFQGTAYRKARRPAPREE
jgi:uncharacterized domain 1